MMVVTDIVLSVTSSKDAFPDDTVASLRSGLPPTTRKFLDVKYNLT